MVWLANILLAVVGSAASFFGLQLAKKTAFAAAAVAAFLALTGAFVVAAKAILAGLVVALPAEFLGTAAAFLPDNLAACIGAMIGVRVARWIYDYHVETLRLVSFIT